MLCDECKKNQATYHSIKKVNGVSSEKHLCRECHQKLGGQALKVSDIGEIFSGFKNLFELPKRAAYRCSKCGTTGEEFLNAGFLGCADCYDEMSQLILPVIQKVQNDVNHNGKTPFGFELDDRSEYQKLKAELEKAIEVENFEEAMIIRDRMRTLRGD